MRYFMCAVAVALSTLIAAAPAAGAGAVHSSGSVPIALPVSCLGEFVVGTLSWTTVSNVHASGNGGTHVATNQNWSGSVVGADSGTTWTIQGAHPFIMNVQGDQSTIVVEDMKLGISQGSAPNIKFFRSFHNVVSANGEVRVASSDVFISCFG